MAMTTISMLGRLCPPAVSTHHQSSLARSSQRLKRLAGIGLFATILTACTSPEERMFMHECTGGGNPGLEDQCECTYEKITDRYSVEQLNAMSERLEVPEDFEQVVMQAGMSCRSNN